MIRFSRPALISLVLVVLVLVLSESGLVKQPHASPSSGTIELTGRVLDDQGQGLAGAFIQVLTQDGRLIAQTISQNQGFYRIGNVRTSPGDPVRLLVQRPEFGPILDQMVLGPGLNVRQIGPVLSTDQTAGQD